MLDFLQWKLVGSRLCASFPPSVRQPGALAAECRPCQKATQVLNVCWRGGNGEAAEPRNNLQLFRNQGAIFGSV